MNDNNDSPIIHQCPAQKTWWDRHTFVSIYKDVDFHQSPIGSFPDNPFKVKESETEKGVYSYKDERWKDSGITVDWSTGPMADEKDLDQVEWDHWHTSFQINTNQIHIDFISFFRWGPQTAYREYRVFSNNKEIGRGGGFSGFLMGNFSRRHYWPLIVEIEDHLIYIFNALQPWSGLSCKGKIINPNCVMVLKKIPD